jgi:hypothetical protein
MLSVIEANAKDVNEMLLNGCECVEKEADCLEAMEKEAHHRES